MYVCYQNWRENSGTCLQCVWQRPEMTYRQSLMDFIQTRTQSSVSHTHHIPDLKYAIFTISRNNLEHITLTFVTLDHCFSKIDWKCGISHFWPCDLDQWYWPWPWWPWPWPLFLIVDGKWRNSHFWPALWPWPTTFDLAIDLDLRGSDLGSFFLIVGWKWEVSVFLPWRPWPLTYSLDLWTCSRYDCIVSMIQWFSL